ncbi:TRANSMEMBRANE PROTEIN [Salix purpurea]|uniref:TRANSMEMBRANE PROTEIN n=1 Tax=Salix purpurea TaxID=77065 RepID=A0A9Q0W8I7_SALPP|nr:TRANSMEMBRANE PROTEIN [Salix purpurea]
MAGRWSTSTFRQWLGLDLSYFTSSLWSSPVSVLRWWPSHLTANPSSWWVTRRLLRWPELDFSIVDDVVWSLVTAFESVALISMLALYLLFCGCTV